MSLDSYMKPRCHALGAAFALAATTAFANLLAPQTSVPQTSVQLAVADSTEAGAGAPISNNAAQLSSERGRGSAGGRTGTRSTASLYLADSDDLQLLFLELRQAGVILSTD